MKETWKDIPEYEGLYQVSNLGRVKSLPKTWINGKGGMCTTKEKILKLSPDRDGYLLVSLHKNRCQKSLKVHRIVMRSFIGESKLQVDHIDFNKTNNHLRNLRYVNHRENNSRGKKNKTSKYTGVYFDKNAKRWRSHILINKKQYLLGYFADEIKASNTYQRALKNWREHKMLPR